MKPHQFLIKLIDYKPQPITSLFHERKKTMRTNLFSFVVLIMVVCVFSSGSAQVPHMINYQGKLTKTGTCALDTTIAMTFKIYGSSGGTDSLWWETQNSVAVEDGIFNVLLGSVNPIPDSVFNGDSTYLGIKVGGDSEMTPRKPIVSVGYAFHSSTADTAFNVVSAGIISVDGVSNPGGDVDLIENNAITITPNDGANTITIGETHSGRTDNPHQVTAAQAGALVSTDGVSNPGGDVDFVAGSNITITPDDGANTITFSAIGDGGGGWIDDGTVIRLETDTDSVGIGTTNPSTKLEVEGDALISGKATIGPGHMNTGIYAFVAGNANTASGDSSTVGGGAGNVANASRATVSGGAYNNATDFAAAVGGGTYNVAAVFGATVSGGMANLSGDTAAMVGGGSYNKAWGKYSVVAGGGGGDVSDSNSAFGDWSTISGGRVNTTSQQYATVGGGRNNTASGAHATVGGGWYHTASGGSATVGGGYFNEASGIYATVGGGRVNSASGDSSTIGGGSRNTASADAATVGGGWDNTADGWAATVAGGRSNSADHDYATVGGGWSNFASGYLATIGGGRSNIASGDSATVAGGAGNTASGSIAVVGGGKSNSASGSRSTVGGGGSNNASDGYATVGGGYADTASGEYATVGGGWSNKASNAYATVGGGSANVASAGFGTVAGGVGNIASGFGSSTVGGGGYNIASGTGATVPGGSNNTAAGVNSFAAGSRAKANHYSTFVWADSTSADFASTGAGQFLVRASGGVGLGSGSPGTRALYVTNDFTGAFSQMVEFESSTDPSTDNDMLAVDAPSTAPAGFQFIECARGSDNEFKVNGDGNVYADGGYNTPASDFAEMIRVSSGASTVEPGDVMVIDPNNLRATLKSSQTRSTLVAGIYSTKPGFIGSERDWDKPTGQEELGTYTLKDMATEFNEIPLAVVGIVPCKVSAENGPIHPGDLLVTSSTPGHAMRDNNPKVGTVLGKALGSLSSGTGVIKVLVTLH
jgi:hypothetical protein